MKTKLSLSFLLSFSFYLLSSQVPQGFNYQAIARDGDGNLITDAFDIKLEIQNLAADTVFWIEEHTVTPNDYGLISFVVGQSGRIGGTATNFSDIDWASRPRYLKTWADQGSGYALMGTTQIWSVPYSLVAKEVTGPVERLGIKGTTDEMDEALFEVRNKYGQIIFAVYNQGVRIYVDDSGKGVKGGFAIGGFGTAKDKSQPYFIVKPDTVRVYINQSGKGVKGGFAIGGYGADKTDPQNFLFISDDSVRIYVDNADADTLKGVKGGFAIGGYGTSKGDQKFFMVSNDSVRIYVDNNETDKGPKGGFAIGGYGTGKGYPQKLLTVSDDSIRVYINDDNSSKGAKGGFAIGGFDKAKGGGNKNFLNVEIDTLGKVPSQPRILWYPIKNAFFTGQVLIQHRDSVGWNATATGYESRAFGDQSQAMGYRAIARGNYSTAIGKNAFAAKHNSFAFGEDVYAKGLNSYTLGKSAIASGNSSYAFGENVIAGTATSSNCYAFGRNSQAIGNGSYAFGDGAIASGTYATAFGRSAQATNTSSFAFGESAVAESPNSFALGLGSHAFGSSCYAFGESAQASDQNSFALGKSANASGANSFAAGWGAIASAEEAVSIGRNTNAYGAVCIAMGFGSEAGSQHSGVALGEYAKSHGYSSVSAGYWTLAEGTGSVALGLSTKSMNNGCTALGRYNLGLSNSLFEIGNGTGESSRSNAFTILDGGSVGIGTSQPIRNLHLASDGISSEFIMETKGGLADWRKWEFVVYDGVGGSELAQNLYLRILNDDGTGISQNVMSWLSTGAVYMPQVYSQFVGPTNRALWIDDSGKLGYNASSIRYKENIFDLNNINWLYELRPVIYNYKGSKPNEVQYGLIAEEVEDINPRLIIYDKDNKPDGLMYEKLSIPILKAVQEQKEEIEAVKQENNQLKSELQSLREEMDQIKAMMAGNGSNK